MTSEKATCYSSYLFCWNGPREKAMTVLLKMMHRLCWIKCSARELFVFLTKVLHISWMIQHIA